MSQTWQAQEAKARSEANFLPTGVELVNPWKR